MDKVKQQFLDSDGLAYYHEQISEKFVTKSEYSRVEEEIKASQNDIEKLEKELIEAKTALQSDVDTASSDIQSAKATLSRVQEEANSLAETVNGYYNDNKGKIGLLNTQVSEQGDSIVGLMTSIEKIGDDVVVSSTQIASLGDSVAAVEARVTTAEATLDTLVGIDFDDIEAIAGLKTRVDATESAVTTLTDFKTSTTDALTSIQNKATAQEASITELTKFKTDNEDVITETKSIANAAKASIESITNFEGDFGSALTSKIEQTTANNATIKSIAAYNGGISGLIQDVTNSKSSTTLINELNGRVAEIKSEVDGQSQSINLLVSDENSSAAFKLSNTATGSKATLKADHIDIDGLVEELNVEELIANSIDTEQITADVLESASANIDNIIAEKVNVDSITASVLEATEAEIENIVAETISTAALNADNITSGTLSADRIDATELKVAAANITGKLVATQIDVDNLEVNAANIKGSLTFDKVTGLQTSLDTKANTSTVSTLQTQVNKLPNEGRVTEITRNTITTENLTATNLHVNAANIDGTLTAKQIHADYIGSQSDKIKEIAAQTITADTVNAVDINASSITTGTLAADRIDANYINSKKAEIENIVADKIEATSIDADNITTGTLSSKNKNFQINLDEGTITSPGFNLDEDGNVSVIGTITSNDGSIGDFTINDSIYSGGKVFFDDNKDGVHLGADGIGLGNNKFTVDPEGYATMTSGNIGGWDIDETNLTSGNLKLYSMSNDKSLPSLIDSDRSTDIKLAATTNRTENYTLQFDIESTKQQTYALNKLLKSAELKSCVATLYYSISGDRWKINTNKDYFTHTYSNDSTVIEKVDFEDATGHSITQNSDGYWNLGNGVVIGPNDIKIDGTTVTISWSAYQITNHVDFYVLINYSFTESDDVPLENFEISTNIEDNKLTIIPLRPYFHPVAAVTDSYLTFEIQAEKGVYICEDGSIYAGAAQLDDLRCSTISAAQIKNIDGSKKLFDVSTDIVVCNGIYPEDNTITLGRIDKAWNQIYSRRAVIATSDKNEKYNIKEIDDKYSLLFNNLKPTSYKFRKNANDRTHIGFIAQDVEQALGTAGLTSQDFAGLCYWDKENGTKGYGLRYEEFIALNTHEIQKIKKENETLKQENADIKAQLKTIEDKLQLYIDYVNKL